MGARVGARVGARWVHGGCKAGARASNARRATPLGTAARPPCIPQSMRPPYSSNADSNVTCGIEHVFDFSSDRLFDSRCSMLRARGRGRELRSQSWRERCIRPQTFSVS